ncbi:MAG: OmpA family protein [Caulobacteraceae bacterium]
MTTHMPGRWRGAGLGLAAAGFMMAAAGCQSVHKPVVARGPVIQTPPACADFTVSIYFESRSAAITPQADRLLAAAANRARGCSITGVHVVGLSDAPGDPDANLVLSKQRADAVTGALHRRGFTTVAFQVAAKGDVGAETVAGQERPLRRRADVQIRLVPPAPRR